MPSKLGVIVLSTWNPVPAKNLQKKQQTKQTNPQKTFKKNTHTHE